ncbi:MAG: hypothetical protein C4532_16085 [Candidatus Abyssobacteria bacterium SURF_17]|uniref:Uncharacterized protein n=1 Tax=Candidatus Abyssobacteria bacterium SURF_17 TaxID=2093361 RepID=A0A419ESA3_9BACT|nr:MAG: hypothetical protein C4532_16085 [Candidatus Abyssubacteria bacterium SURF_17]
MEVLCLTLNVLWFWSIGTFTRWRVLELVRKGGECVNPLNDWAVQLYVRGTAFLLLVVILYLAS